MKISTIRHVELEEALELAFPRSLIPSLDNVRCTGYAVPYLKELFAEKSWQDVVGERMLGGEMDIGLSIWMSTLPPEVFDYYVASYLMLASLSPASYRWRNWVRSVMEAFILPPLPESPEATAEIDERLAPDADVASCGADRLSFYRRITPAQRLCVGRFLEIYLDYHSEEFNERGVQLFEQNCDYWLQSLR